MTVMTRADLVAELQKAADIMTDGEFVVVTSRDVYSAVIVPDVATIAIDFANDGDAVGFAILRNRLPNILAALQDADRLEGENKRLQAEVDRLTAQASACPWCRPVREIFTEAT